MNILGPLLGFLLVYYLEALFFDQKEQAPFFLSFLFIITAVVFYFFNVPYYDILLIVAFMQACIGFLWTILILPEFLFLPRKLLERVYLYIPRIEFANTPQQSVLIPASTPPKNVPEEKITIHKHTPSAIRKNMMDLLQEKITISFEMSFHYSKKSLHIIRSIFSILEKMRQIVPKAIPLQQSLSVNQATMPLITNPSLPVIPHTGVSAWPLQLMKGSYTAYKSRTSNIDQLRYFQSLVPLKIVEREKVAPYENVMYYQPEKKDEAAYIAAFLALPFKLKENENMGDDIAIILW